MGGPRAWPILALAGLLRAEAPEALLAKVDRLRHPWASYSVEVDVKDTRNTQRWRVLARENGDARVEGLSEKEAGRAVLMLGEQMWLLLPNARKPVKVTPQQRLLGPAAGGDIARSRFAEDYRVAARTEENVDGRPCVRLELEARRPALSYRRALLWVSSSGEPVQAEFRLASGKLAKRVRFEAPVQAAGRAVLAGMVLEDPGGATAQVRFSNWTPAKHDPRLFELPAGKPDPAPER